MRWNLRKVQKAMLRIRLGKDELQTMNKRRLYRAVLLTGIIGILLVGGYGRWLFQAQRHQYALDRQLIVALQRDDTAQALSLVNRGADPNTHCSPLIGMVTLFDIQNQYKAEIGYWLGAAYHGQGIMTEAVRAVVSHAFDTMGMGRLYAYTSVENTQSLAMLRKVGFVMEGVMRQHTLRDGRWDDSVIMGIIQDDFSRDRRE